MNMILMVLSLTVGSAAFADAEHNENRMEYCDACGKWVNTSLGEKLGKSQAAPAPSATPKSATRAKE